MEVNKFSERRLLQPEPEGLTLKSLKSKIFRNWHLFVVFCVLGLVSAFVYKKIVSPYYKISTTILIKSDKSSEINNVFRELTTNSGKAAIQDQVGVLKSYNLNLKAVQYLNWRYSWAEKGLFTSSDIYGNDPYLIDSVKAQMENVPLTIKTVSEDSYTIECDEEVKLSTGNKVKIEFKKQLKFGEPFDHQYFHFVLLKRPDRPVVVGEQYRLVFNNLGDLALSYKNKLDVKQPEDAQSNLINVELKTSNLLRDVDYLNQLGKVYIQFGLDEKNRMANNTIKFIDDQITGVNQSLQMAGDKFTSFRAQNRTVDLGQEASTVVEKLKQIEGERSNVDLKLEYYNNLKYYLENRDQNKDLVAPSLVGVTDEALNQKVIRLNELYVKREVLSYTAQERNPVLIQLTNEIEYTQKTLKENVENLIANSNVELQNLNERQRAVNSQLSRLPKTEQDLIGIKRNFDLNNELYTFLLQRRAEAEIAKASNNPDAQILDPSDTSIAVLLGPILLFDLLVGFFGGLFVAFFVVLVKELLAGVLTDVEDITSRLDVPVVGTITYNKYKTEKAVLSYPRSALTESFRGLRLNLEYFFQNVNGKVLAVHSYLSGEGKSFVAFNLAVIFALGKKKVLLVDADLRKSRLHKILEMDPEIGLSNFLYGENTLSEVVKPTEIANLSFVASGSNHDNSSELLNNGVLRDFIEQAKEQFDYIILDNAPFGVVYDPVIVGMYSDFNLLLVRLNQSNEEEIDAINKIAHDGILKNVMVAVNGKKQVKSHGYYTEETKSDGTKNDGIKTEEIHIPEEVIPVENSTLEKAKVAIASVIDTLKAKKEQIHRAMEK
jgi:capsular exopolysaccharide synthesis family protein